MDAFDLIVKPLVPEEAVQAVKRALWQNRLLTLLASQEHATDVLLAKLAEPLRWRTPKMIFVNSMSDLFHEQVPDEFVVKCFHEILHNTLDDLEALQLL